MTAAPPTAGRSAPRRPWTLTQQTFLRRPVSAVRARIGWMVLAALVAAWALFRAATSNTAIQRRAVHFLTAATGGEVSVGAARFSLFGGITLTDVRVSTPFDPLLDLSARDGSEREIFSASSVRLLHDPWRLPWGLVVREIIATHPRLTIVQNADTGRFNWQALFQGLPAQRRVSRIQRPLMRLRQAEVRLVTRAGDGRRNGESLRLDADVRPQPAQPTGYLIDIRQLSGRYARGRMAFDPVQGTLSDTPALGLATIREVLPRVYREFFERLSLAGDVRSEHIRYGGPDPAQRRYALSLSGVRFVIPLSMLRSGRSAVQPPALPDGGHKARRSSTADGGSPDGSHRSARSAGSNPEPPAFEFRDISGRIDLANEEVHVSLDGYLNDAPSRVRGALRRIDQPLEHVGLDLEIESRGLRLPEGATRERIRSGEAVPAKIRDFLRAFDPHGVLDVECSLHRRAGGDAPLLFRGVLQPRGASARYEQFPYRVDGLTGRVRFSDEGILLDDLAGHHESASIRINGRVNHAAGWTGVDLRIDGRAVPLDGMLFDALSPTYRDLWRRFDPRGCVRTEVHLVRAEGAPQTGPGPWQSELSVDFEDTAVRFDRFPYPLEAVRGRLRFSPGVIQVEGLTGRPAESAPPQPPLDKGGPGGVVRETPRTRNDRTPPTVRVDGTFVDVVDAESPHAAGPRIDLRLEARNLPLDDRLAAALPEEAREAFRQFRPAGRAHLTGRIFRDGLDEALRYDVEAELCDASVRHTDLPYPFQQVDGRMRITPERIAVIDVTGANGSTRLSVTGEVRKEVDGLVADLVFNCRELDLDDAVRAALSGPLSEAWDILSPMGRLDLTTRLHRAVRAGRTTQRHRTVIDLRAVGFALRGFPIPVHDLTGRIEIDPRRILVRDVHGRCGDAAVSIGGSIDLAGGARSGALRVEARGLSLDELRTEVLPAAVRPTWDALAPRGELDLALEVLRFRPADDGALAWEWQGTVSLRGAALRLGFDLTDLTGEIAGGGTVGGPRGFSTRFTARMRRARLGPFDLRDLALRGEMESAAVPLHLLDGRAALFGGEAAGQCAVSFGPRGPQYELWMEVRDAALADYLAASGRLARQPSAVRGRLFGRLSLRGRAGRPDDRRGAGEFFVREAGGWKLPLVLALFPVLGRAPDEDVFHDGWLTFQLDGARVRFTRIDLQGRSLALVGSGTMDLRTDELDLRLLAGSPHRLRLPLLSELLESAARDLLELEVTGTPRHPRVESRSLRDLRRSLESVLPDRTPPDRAAPR